MFVQLRIDATGKISNFIRAKRMVGNRITSQEYQKGAADFA